MLSHTNYRIIFLQFLHQNLHTILLTTNLIKLIEAIFSGRFQSWKGSCNILESGQFLPQAQCLWLSHSKSKFSFSNWTNRKSPSRKLTDNHFVLGLTSIATLLQISLPLWESIWRRHRFRPDLLEASRSIPFSPGLIYCLLQMRMTNLWEPHCYQDTGYPMSSCSVFSLWR